MPWPDNGANPKTDNATAQSAYPIMRGYDYRVEASPHKYAEYQGREDAPSGVPTFQMLPKESPGFALGEYAHLLAENDPWYQMLANRFTAGASPEMMARDRALQPKQDPHPFDQYWDHVSREAHVRATLFPEIFGGREQGWDEAQSYYSPQQRNVLEAIVRYLKQQQFDAMGRNG